MAFLDTKLVAYQAHINALLSDYLPHGEARLHQAMRYSLLAGGKRLRPLLVYAAGEVSQASSEKLDYAALAVELVHGYSLIHDDLPAMDNDALRHGIPTCHKVYGEALAILAGDALQSLAFEVLAKNEDAKQIVLLAKAIGAEGMALGQARDMFAAQQITTLQHLQSIHQQKTGALISASIQLGVQCGQLSASDTQTLLEFSSLIGLAFQIQDDILDVESSTSVLGKTQGADIQQKKITYVTLLGLSEAKLQLAVLYEKTEILLQAIPRADSLREIFYFLKQRNF